MKSVNIAKFKSELGKYLGYVRQGEEILVFDRKEPLARVIPIRKEAASPIIIEDALDDPAHLFSIIAKPLAKTTDSLKFLQAERAG